MACLGCLWEKIIGISGRQKALTFVGKEALVTVFIEANLIRTGAEQGYTGIIQMQLEECGADPGYPFY